MGNPADMIPYYGDAIPRRQDDTNRKLREQGAARSLAASQMGNGGILKIDGDLEVTGSITVPGTLASAGALTAGTDILAGDDVTAGGTVTGASVVSTGAMSAAGLTTLGPINSGFSRGHTVLSGYANAYWDGNGDAGVNVSSVAYKQDITPVNLDPEVTAILSLALVNFRYIAAVEELGDQAPVEVGAIAEYVESLGLGEWVFRDADGTVQGISYERLTIPLIAIVQNLDARLKALEQA